MICSQCLIIVLEQGDMSQRHDVDTIEVRGFKASTSDETLVSFFENKRKSGGGDITKSHIDRTNNVFTATFEQPAG